VDLQGLAEARVDPPVEREDEREGADHPLRPERVVARLVPGGGRS
jgi:hypothetical protein